MLSQFKTPEKIAIIVVVLFSIFVIGTGGFIVFKKVNISTAVNTTISNIATIAATKKNEIVNGISMFKTQMGDSLSNKENLQVTISFNTNESKILGKDIPTLQKIITFSKTHPDYTVSIFGYTDRSGTDLINIPLSMSRTEAVKKYLNNEGVNSIQSVGFGSSKDSRSVDITITTK